MMKRWIRMLIAAAVIGLPLAGAWADEAAAGAAVEAAKATPAEAKADDEAKEAPTPLEQLAVINALKPSMVSVEYTLKVDKGAWPYAAGYRGSWARYRGYSGFRRLITEERPMELPGYVLSPTEVILLDPMIHPRFVESIAVRYGQQVVPAKVSAYCLEQTAIRLTLSAPLTEARPLAFDAAGEEPYYSLGFGQVSGKWRVTMSPMKKVLVSTVAGRSFLSSNSNRLIVDADGTPVGMSMKTELPLDDSWKGSPLTWPVLTAEQMEKALDALKARFDKSVLRVQLGFRSPRKDQAAMRRRSYGEEDASTERNVLGRLIDADRVLVMAGLKPDVTARLERITVHVPGREPVAARFAHTLKDYGAFVVKLETPLAEAVAVDDRPITAWRNKLLLAADVEIQGEKIIAYYAHRRIESFDLGYRGELFPDIPGDEEGLMLFDPADGKLVAGPVIRRKKVASGDYGDDEARLTPVAHLTGFLYGDLAGHVDPNNTPLTEEEESRLAWLGTVLQPLDKELARINKVSHLTRDGETGAMVAYVYPDSPAAKAGIEAGDILIRLHAADQPKPIEVRVQEYNPFGGPFPWAKWGQLPEAYFDRVPQPWAPAENKLTRALTDLGFGKAFEAEFSREGEVFRKPFTVRQSPRHYDMAARSKTESLGLTVRDMTYEVRRYFQRRSADPGVIVSKIEPGSKASVAGLKPFEIITHVNDRPVMTAADFAEAVGADGDLELAVKRMTKGRVVKIKRKAAAVADKDAAGKDASTDKDAADKDAADKDASAGKAATRSALATGEKKAEE